MKSFDQIKKYIFVLPAFLLLVGILMGIQYLNTTPALSDESSQTEYVDDCCVTFSAPSGFYDDDFSLTLSAPDGFSIYYTLDGSLPDETSEPTRLRLPSQTFPPQKKSMQTRRYFPLLATTCPAMCPTRLISSGQLESMMPVYPPML